MSKFYVVLAHHDKVSDAGRATSCRRKFEALSLPTKSTKNEGPSEIMGFYGKTVWFQTKNNKKILVNLSKKPSGTHGP